MEKGEALMIELILHWLPQKKRIDVTIRGSQFCMESVNSIKAYQRQALTWENKKCPPDCADEINEFRISESWVLDGHLGGIEL